jgi:hypothetical protein
MAVTVELLLNGRVVDGVDEWWDDMEAALHGRESTSPLLSKVDPYGTVEFVGDELVALSSEIADLLPELRQAMARRLAERLAKLCESAITQDGARLRFRGD